MMSTTAPHPPPLDPLCPACGYNLRSATGNTCPECGKPFVLLAVRPEEVLDPAVSPVGRRVKLMLASRAWLVWIVIVLVAVSTVGARGWFPFLETISGRVEQAALGLFAAAVCVAIAACWVFTALAAISLYGNRKGSLYAVACIALTPTLLLGPVVVPTLIEIDARRMWRRTFES